jgi:hypothetical protein
MDQRATKVRERVTRYLIRFFYPLVLEAGTRRDDCGLWGEDIECYWVIAKPARACPLFASAWRYLIERGWRHHDHTF